MCEESMANNINTVKETFSLLFSNTLKMTDYLSCRTKLGIPLLYSCMEDPIGTMNFLQEEIEKRDYSPMGSIVLVASASFCFQFIPKSERKKVINKLQVHLIKHAIPTDVDQFSQFGKYFEAGGAQLLPCPSLILSKIVNHQDLSISTSPKLIVPLIRADPLRLGYVLYNSQINEIHVKHLYLIGRLHSELSIPLPVPKNTEYLLKLQDLCFNILENSQIFIEIEGALTCVAQLLQWGSSIEKFNEFLKAIPSTIKENSSLFSLLISALGELVKNKGPEFIPSREILMSFQKDESQNIPKQIQTAFLSLISSALQYPGTDILNPSMLQIPHWFIEASRLEWDKSAPNEKLENSTDLSTEAMNFSYESSNSSSQDITSENYLKEIQNEIDQKRSQIIINSPSIYDLSIGDIDLLANLSNYVPAWIYVHALRVRTKDISLASHLVRFISTIPNYIFTHYFSDFEAFIDMSVSIGLAPEINNLLLELVSLFQANHKISYMIHHFGKRIDYFNSNSIQSYISLINTLLPYSYNKKIALSIFDTLIEALEFKTIHTLSSTFLTTIFDFFSYLTSLRPEKQHFIWELALTICYVPFYPKLPFQGSLQAQELFQQNRLYFNVISSDIVKDPLFSLKKAFPPFPSALNLISSLSLNQLSKLSNDVDKLFSAELLIKCLTLSPLESVLAAKILPQNQKNIFSQALKHALSFVETSSFVFVACSFLSEEPKSILLFDEHDNIPIIISYNHGFVPLLSQFPQFIPLLTRVSFHNIETNFIESLVSLCFSEKNFTDFKNLSIVRRMAQHFQVDQPPILHIGWEEYEFSDSLAKFTNSLPSKINNSSSPDLSSIDSPLDFYPEQKPINQKATTLKTFGTSCNSRQRVTRKISSKNNKIIRFSFQPKYSAKGLANSFGFHTFRTLISEDSRINSFRVRYSTPGNKDDPVNLIHNAMKIYRKNPACNSYLFASFIQIWRTIIETSGVKFWLLSVSIPFSYKIPLSMIPNTPDNIKCIAFVLRNGPDKIEEKEKIEADEDNFIFYEKLRVGCSHQKIYSSFSLFLLFGEESFDSFLSNNESLQLLPDEEKIWEKDPLIPSYRIHYLKRLNYLKNNHQSIDDLNQYCKGYFFDTIQSIMNRIDYQNPVMANEAFRMLQFSFEDIPELIPLRLMIQESFIHSLIQLNQHIGNVPLIKEKKAFLLNSISFFIKKGQQKKLRKLLTD